MTDLDFLNKAASAAGLIVVGLADKMLVYPEHWAGGLIVETPTGGHKAWNPLTDDGDALRLAVKLGIRVHCVDLDRAEVDMGSEGSPIFWQAVTKTNDAYAATRRAIVRAAAALAA